MSDNHHRTQSDSHSHSSNSDTSSAARGDSADPADSRQIGLGVDYGTSNSATAIFDGQNIHLIHLEKNSTVMPSATYIDRDFQIKTGQSAIHQYIESNTGRTVELSAEILGEARTTTGQTGDHGLPEEANTQTLYGQSFVDGGQQGRLFRGIKRLLGSSDSQRLLVFDRPFRLVALITPLLVRIKKTIAKQIRNTPLAECSIDHACIGHPVNFEGQSSKGNTQALSLLAEAYGHAEFNEQSYYPEPNAAALSYLYANPNQNEQLILAVDFGGGTLDLCIVRCKGKEFNVIATHGIGLGGDHIDQLLFRELLFPLLGKGERWRRAGLHMEIETLFPFEEYEELLLNWAVSYMLNQNKYTTPLMQLIGTGDEAAIKFQRLYDLIKNNYSYLVSQSIKELKATLSSQEEALLDIPELDIELIVTRAEFEVLIQPLLRKLETAVALILEKSEMCAGDIQLVIRTGGSSLIPAVKGKSVV